MMGAAQAHILTSLIQDRSASGKRYSSAQRQNAQTRIQARNGLRGDRNAAAKARQLRASRPSPGNLAVRKNATRQDSNPQPDRYGPAAQRFGLRAIPRGSAAPSSSMPGAARQPGRSAYSAGGMAGEPADAPHPLALLRPRRQRPRHRRATKERDELPPFH